MADVNHPTLSDSRSKPSREDILAELKKEINTLRVGKGCSYDR